ncbi:MAG TPA: hypothetical protein VEQ42_07955 [Pyrinomonadaceae bacterium]|nr:hypothetical protein [Pyrinomonadaceae bacterium]
MSSDRLTEVLNYLSAMSREFGDFRRQLAENNKRLEAVETRMSSLESEVRTGFEEVRGDIRRLKHAMEIFNEESMELRIEQRDLRKRVEALERKQA